MSCDTYFYELGKRFYNLPPDRGHPLQGWANRFGLGGLTGIDISPEAAGLIPTPECLQEAVSRRARATASSTAPGSRATRSRWRSARGRSS